MATFTEFGIDLPLGAIGEVRTTCLRCSASRRTSHDACLAVSVDEGT
jgi:hypothetical protein